MLIGSEMATTNWNCTKEPLYDYQHEQETVWITNRTIDEGETSIILIL